MVSSAVRRAAQRGNVTAQRMVAEEERTQARAIMDQNRVAFDSLLSRAVWEDSGGRLLTAADGAQIVLAGGKVTLGVGA